MFRLRQNLLFYLCLDSGCTDVHSRAAKQSSSRTFLSTSHRWTWARGTWTSSFNFPPASLWTHFNISDPKVFPFQVPGPRSHCRAYQSLTMWWQSANVGSPMNMAAGLADRSLVTLDRRSLRFPTALAIAMSCCIVPVPANHSSIYCCASPRMLGRSLIESDVIDMEMRHDRTPLQPESTATRAHTCFHADCAVPSTSLAQPLHSQYTHRVPRLSAANPIT